VKLETTMAAENNRAMNDRALAWKRVVATRPTARLGPGWRVEATQGRYKSALPSTPA